MTLDQLQTNIDPTYCVCWDASQYISVNNDMGGSLGGAVVEQQQYQ